MPLTLVTGRPNAGKTGRLYQVLTAAAVAGAEPVLALPSMPDARRAADEFALRGSAGVRACVLDQWVADLWALYGDGTRIVTSAVRAALVREACESERFGALAASANTPGFTRMVADIAERIPDPKRARPRGDEERELVAVLSRYARLLEREGLVELSRAMLFLSEAPPPTVGPVALNRFTDLSAGQEAFVRGLAAAVEVLVALPWEVGHPATGALTPLVGRLASAGSHEHIGSGTPVGELQWLEAELFCGTRPLEPSGAVAFAEAASIDLESARAVDLAVEAVRAGTPPNRIAIAFRAAVPRVPLVVAAARQAGIELDADVSLPLAGLPMGRALLALVDVVTGQDDSRERLAAYLLSPYSGLVPDELESLDARWRRRRTAGRRLLEEASAAGRNRAIALARRACSAPLTAENAKTWKYLLDEMLASSRHHPEAADDGWDAAVHRAALNTVSSLADGLCGGAPLPDVGAALRQTRVVRGGPERDGAVLLTEAHRIRSRRFDVVILGGLSADEFSPEPARSPRRGLLERLGVPGGADESEAERLLFYSAVTRPRERLHLLRHTSDSAGRPIAASSFWSDTLDLYREPGALDSESRPAGVPFVTVDAAAVACGGIAYTPLRRETRVAGRGGERSPSRGKVCSVEVKRALSEREEFGVRELEVYGQCPYRWFFEHELRPRAIDAALEPRHAGTMAHAALARFYDRWSPDGARRVTPETLDEALDVTREVLDEVLSEWPAALDLGEQLALDDVRGWVTGAIRDDALALPGYLPIAHEFTFGCSEGRPVRFGGVLVRGRVDRIDALGGSLIVTDYKTSADIHGHASFAIRRTIQLPVYLAAAAEHLGGDAHGAVFRSLSARTARGFWRDDHVSFHECGTASDAVDADALDRILDETAGRVAAAARGIRSGEIAPQREACAERCVARSACEAVARW